MFLKVFDNDTILYVNVRHITSFTECKHSTFVILMCDGIKYRVLYDGNTDVYNNLLDMVENK